MPYLKAILMNANDKADCMLRAKAMECISLVGMERFRNDAKQVMEVLMVFARISNGDENRSEKRQSLLPLISILNTSMPSSSSYCHPAPATSSSRLCNCDVFLSFRGEDTRKTFVDHLYSALVDRKILTYKDNETLPRGESIRPSLFKAIKGSQIAVIIFSKSYADSSWCLEELTYIMKCKDKRGLIVMPVFYDVVPSELRKQGFVKQEAENINQVESWRKALVGACEIAGWETKDIANGHESKAIKEIVDTISDKLFLETSCVDEDLVGMSARLQELEEQLDIGSHGVHMVGLWGVGGSGKTTLASSLYMKISRYFQGHCIIDNIREESSKHGLKTLQEKFLSRLLKTEMKLQSVEEGKHMIRSRLNHSNVLIILDDVDDSKQLDALAGSHSWFGRGSLIIITTRDEHLLITHKVNLVFPIRLLSDKEAIQLFNKRAYNEKKPLKDYDTLSLRVVSYAARLPLALKVLGSFLYDKDEKEWRSTLDRLQNTPQTEILEQLKISYDGLESVEKEIFLDIACFLRWTKTDEAMEILEACGYHPCIGIRVLRQKALITIVNDMFDMHDLVQEMGQYIVRMEHPNDPRKHSRVWKPEEIKNMCLSDATTENYKIEAIRCWFRYPDHISPFYKYVSNMKKLRYLHMAIDHVDVDKNAKGPTFLSNELRYIKWNSYPRSPFPDTFKAVKLVILKLSYSPQKKLWKGYKHLPHLKVLQLKHMTNLLSTPDFDGLPSLQKLTLRYCTSLEKIHPSLGKHTSLEHTSVKNCAKLRMFPTIIHMKKLKTLKIKSCHKSLEFSEIKSNMESLEKLDLEGIWIDVLLPSVGERCANLISLRLYHCFYSTSIAVNFSGLKHLDEFHLQVLDYMKIPDNICSSWLIGKVVCGRDQDRNLFLTRKLPFVLSQLTCNLRKLDLRCCGLKDGELPSGIGKMSNLEELNLSGNYLTRLDFTLSQLTRLKILDISRTWLVEFPKLPSSLIVLKANNCIMFTITKDSFTNCKRLCDISLVGVRIINDCDELLESMLQGKAVENHRIRLVLQGVKIAKEFIPPFFIRGNICRLKLPKNWRNDFSGFLMCVVLSTCTGNYTSTLNMLQEMSGMESKDDVVRGESNDDNRTHVWYVSFGSLSHTTWWNSIDKAVSISFQLQIYGDAMCGGFGVRMVARSGPTETSTTHEEYDISRYTPKINIEEDSQHLLKISSICQ